MKKDNNNPAPTDECTKGDFSKLKPDISISVSGDLASGLSISANIDSPFGIDKVTFSVDGDEVASMGSKPYKTSYDAAGAGHSAGDNVTVKAEIKDDEGNTASDSDSVTL